MQPPSSEARAPKTVAALVWAALAATGCARDQPKIEKETVVTPVVTGTGTPSCPADLPGPALVMLPGPNATSYCMDARETTRGEYEIFLTAKGTDTSGQPGECAWNGAYAPTLFTPSQAQEYPPDESPHWCEHQYWEVPADWPVACVDFCDALAYCEWAGKRLCGRIGGPNKWGRVYVGFTDSATIDIFKPTVVSLESEIYNACTQGGTTKYPYGDQYQAARCIDKTWVMSQSALVTNTAERDCHGTAAPFDAVHDLSGSLDEWQNMCGTWDVGNGNMALGCYNAGGNRYQDAYSGNNTPQQDCAVSGGTLLAEQISQTMGIRCCADTVLVP